MYILLFVVLLYNIKFWEWLFPFELNSIQRKSLSFLRKSSIAYKRNQMFSCKKLLTSSPLETVLSQYTNNSILNKRMTISRVYRSETFCCLGGSLGRRTRWETKQRTNKIMPLSIKISHFGKLTSKPPDFNIVSHWLWRVLIEVIFLARDPEAFWLLEGLKIWSLGFPRKASYFTQWYFI